MNGLTTVQAKEALSKFGLNQLPRKGGESFITLFFRQLKNPLSLLLAVAILISFIVGDRIDAILISLILILNSVLGFWQDFKASRELEALKSFEVTYSRVIRDGAQIEVPSAEIVPGDVVILEPGDKIPADGQIIESYSLSVQESILTGESLPIVKSEKPDENNVFFGTTVVSGRAKFKVLNIGTKTKFGSIAQNLSSIEDDQTPLEKALLTLSKGIGAAAVGVAVLIFAFRTSQGFEMSEMLLTSIALMVAVVPEGLPAVVTIILALGVRKMYQKKALVRKMIAVESLGAATVICSDKTGTLTKNEMRVKEVKVNHRLEDELYRCAVLCNSANLIVKEDGGSFDILGDTTEGALLLWAKEKQIDIDLMRSEGKLVEEIPFDLKKRKMTVFYEEKGKKYEFTKGAPEVLIVESKLSKKDREFWDLEYQKMAGEGLRVLAFSKNGQFLGLLGISDEVRPEVKDAIKLTKQAGIKVVMITGDNELTAKALGEEIGLLGEGDEILTGSELDELSDEEFLRRIERVRIFARIAPESKLRIVKAYQKLGEVVAVTGDGVNDALALKQAEVGVAMGKIGTDVSREASDVVLLDDNFATLVSVIEQGRLIYSNILKVVKFLLAGNLSEVLLIGLAVILGLPIPLLATQILWINFVTDGLPALALGFDSASPNIMRTPPRLNSNILSFLVIRYIAIAGLTIAVACLAIFYWVNMYLGLEQARAVTFSALIVFQMILPFIIRRHHSFLSNKKLVISVGFTLIMQILILTVPILQKLFKL